MDGVVNRTLRLALANNMASNVITVRSRHTYFDDTRQVPDGR
jgi:hypothetical protein